MPQSVARVHQLRNAWMDRLYQAGISTRPATHAVHMLSFYRDKYRLAPGDFPNAQAANDCSISLPLFNGMTEQEQQFVVDVVGQAGSTRLPGREVRISRADQCGRTREGPGPDARWGGPYREPIANSTISLRVVLGLPARLVRPPLREAWSSLRGRCVETEPSCVANTRGWILSVRCAGLNCAACFACRLRGRYIPIRQSTLRPSLSWALPFPLAAASAHSATSTAVFILARTRRWAVAASLAMMVLALSEIPRGERSAFHTSDGSSSTKMWKLANSVSLRLRQPRGHPYRRGRED